MHSYALFLHSAINCRKNKAQITRRLDDQGELNFTIISLQIQILDSRDLICVYNFMKLRDLPKNPTSCMNYIYLLNQKLKIQRRQKKLNIFKINQF